MNINEKTSLRDILAAYPWMPDALVSINSKFKIIKSPLGQMLIQTATVKEAAEMAGYPAETVLRELNKVIKDHEKQD